MKRPKGKLTPRPLRRGAGQFALATDRRPVEMELPRTRWFGKGNGPTAV